MRLVYLKKIGLCWISFAKVTFSLWLCPLMWLCGGEMIFLESQICRFVGWRLHHKNLFGSFQNCLYLINYRNIKSYLVEPISFLMMKFSTNHNSQSVNLPKIQKCFRFLLLIKSVKLWKEKLINQNSIENSFVFLRMFVELFYVASWILMYAWIWLIMIEDSGERRFLKNNFRLLFNNFTQLLLKAKK